MNSKTNKQTTQTHMTNSIICRKYFDNTKHPFIVNTLSMIEM